MTPTFQPRPLHHHISEPTLSRIYTWLEAVEYELSPQSMFAAQETQVYSSKTTPLQQPGKLLLKDGSVRDIGRPLESTARSDGKEVRSLEAKAEKGGDSSGERICGCDAGGRK